jgi:hypothetical protein
LVLLAKQVESCGFVWGVKRKAHALLWNFACGARRQAYAKLHKAEKDKLQ